VMRPVRVGGAWGAAAPEPAVGAGEAWADAAVVPRGLAAVLPPQP
jgi:hypothetical protein